MDWNEIIHGKLNVRAQNEVRDLRSQSRYSFAQVILPGRPIGKINEPTRSFYSQIYEILQKDHHNIQGIYKIPYVNLVAQDTLNQLVNLVIQNLNGIRR